MAQNTQPPTVSVLTVDPAIPGTSSDQETETCAELEDWTKDEKFDLNLGLRHCGYDLKAIQQRIPNKTEEQIQAAIDYFRAQLKIRNESNKLTPKRKRRAKPVPQVPLTKWADFLTKHYHYKDLQTECAKAFRIIGDFEDLPHPSSCEGLDFRKMYYYMADAMEGKPIPDDAKARELFHKCLVECSALGKTFIPKNELQDILSTFSANCNVNRPLPTSDGGLIALRYLAGQKNYNPLNIPEEYLIQPATTFDKIKQPEDIKILNFGMSSSSSSS